MRAIEGLSDRLAERRAFRILDDHGRPGHGLKRDPLQTDGTAKRENGNCAAETLKHEVDGICSRRVRQSTDFEPSPTRRPENCLQAANLIIVVSDQRLTGESPNLDWNLRAARCPRLDRIRSNIAAWLH